MKPNRQGIELEYQEATRLFEVLNAATNSRRNPDKSPELAKIMQHASLGLTYLSSGAPELAQDWWEFRERIRLRALEIFKNSPDLAAKHLQPEPPIDVAKTSAALKKAYDFLGKAGLEASLDPVTVRIPWQAAQKIGRACIMVLQNPECALVWVDPACGGFTSPNVQREAYELVGQVSGVIAAQQGFRSYQYDTAYYDE